MKKYITFIIIALLFTLTTSIMLPALKVNAEIENNTISLEEATKIYRNEEAPYNNAAKESEYWNKTPSITVLTHGYSGAPSHFSNNGIKFAPNTASIINEIIEKTEINGGVNIYYAKYKKETNTGNTIRTLYKLSYSNYDLSSTQVVDIIDDASKHIILIYHASDPTAGHDDSYEEFNGLLDSISLQYKALTGYLPIYNLIGHSRGD